MRVSVPVCMRNWASVQQARSVLASAQAGAAGAEKVSLCKGMVCQSPPSYGFECLHLGKWGA